MRLLYLGPDCASVASVASTACGEALPEEPEKFSEGAAVRPCLWLVFGLLPLVWRRGEAARLIQRGHPRSGWFGVPGFRRVFAPCRLVSAREVTVYDWRCFVGAQPAHSAPMKVWSGTSGFSHESWSGNFYPKGLKANGRLPYFAERLTTVELNNTFYRMPSEQNIRGWVDAVRGGPSEFRFVVKATRRLSHFSKLEGIEELVGLLQQRVEGFGEYLGAVLVQLPPTFRADAEKLRAFLGIWGRIVPLAIEFRHESWCAPEILDLLEEHAVSCCLAETEAGTFPEPWRVTAPFAFLRLRRPEYQPKELARWAKRIAALPVDECFVFLKHDVEGPIHAQKLQQLLRS